MQDFDFAQIQSNLGTFKYHMTLKEGGCSDLQIAVIWRRRFGQIVI